MKPRYYTPFDVVLFCHRNSGSAWVDVMIRALGHSIKKTLNSYDHTDRLLHFTYTPVLLYLRRNPYDTYASAIKKRFKYVNFKLRRERVRDTPETIVKHHIMALEIARCFPNFVLFEYEKLRSPGGFEYFHKVFPKMTPEIWDEYSYDNMKANPFDIKFGKPFYFNDKKLNGGWVGQGKDFLRKPQLERLHNAMEKHDYWNKMKELDDLVL